MDIFQILTEILNNPNAKRYFLELQQYYLNLDMQHESDVIDCIIQEVINKNNESDDNNNN